MPKLIVILGPTASGKTDASLQLAHKLSASGISPEIVNADSMQLYRGMDIATAKLSADQRSQFPHHLFDVFEPEHEVSAVSYQQLARKVITEIIQRGSQPILVGGSMLYLTAVIDEMNFAPTDPSIRASLEAELEAFGAEKMYQKLQQLDAASAEKVDPANHRRIVRALEIIQLQGDNYGATLSKERTLWMPTEIFGIDWDRQLLKQRVATRALQMWQAGLVDEAKALRGRLGPTARVAIGYAQVFDYLDQKLSQDEAIAEIVKLTNRYIKKQMTWFRADDRIRWVSPDNAASGIMDSL